MATVIRAVSNLEKSAHVKGGRDHVRAALRLDSGVRLFDHLAGTPAVLGNPTVIPGVGVTHLRYPVRKA